jgi:hypothetical protein
VQAHLRDKPELVKKLQKQVSCGGVDNRKVVEWLKGQGSGCCFVIEQKGF